MTDTITTDRDFSGEWAIPPSASYEELTYGGLILAVVNTEKKREYYEYSGDSNNDSVIKEYGVKTCLHRGVDKSQLKHILDCKINNKRLLIEPVDEGKFDVYILKGNDKLEGVLKRVPDEVVQALNG